MVVQRYRVEEAPMTGRDAMVTPARVAVRRRQGPRGSLEAQ
ncbi:MAG TPA: hypothetical protein VNC12_02355 [Solirubrobacteraceae bacterium]|nr:hypothetical protein [Solirubrobacteraceae bacterium]